MNKPEKKEILSSDKYSSDPDICFGKRYYNQACDDYEAFLLGEEELKKILQEISLSRPMNKVTIKTGQDFTLWEEDIEAIAKALSKRIRGEE